MRAAGCAYNDIVDRDIDAKVARTAGAADPVRPDQRASRPGPSSSAAAWSAWPILLTMNPLAIALGVGSLALVAAYPFMKRITWWPQAWLGLTFNWGALLGFAAATGAAGPAGPPALRRRACSGPSATTPSTRSRTWRTTPWSG